METAPTRTERFDRLFEAHFDAVRAYAWRRDPATADDVAAETFLVAWRRLEDIPADSLPWLIGVARNIRLNVLRGQRRRAALDARLAGTATPAPVEHESPSGDVRAALAVLSERDREVVLLAAWEGLDTAGIARALGCSRANASLRLFRARKRLAALLGDAHAPAQIGGASDVC
jgi:RNA polymerase sigma-70 factor (ECF subfamily)